ncbi:MAG: HlyD family type I secretion periplasmic adaptor subunit [Geminicoccaceae bacterium]
MAAARLACPPTAEALIDARLPAATNALVGGVACLLLAILAWLALAKVEEVVRAPGRIEPAGQVKIINHPEGGRVATIHVANGDRVEAGAPLVTLQADIRSSEHAQLLGRWQVEAAAAARLEAESTGEPLSLTPDLAEQRPDLVAAQASLLGAREGTLASRRDTLAKAVEAKRAEVRTAAAEVGRVRNSLALLRQQLAAVKELASRGLYPELKLVAVQQQVSDAEGQGAKADAALAAAQAGLAESQSRLAGLEREWHTEVLDEAARTTAERDRLAEELRARQVALDDLVVRAPAAGVVQNLAVTAPGQAVAANETLMRLVPADEGLVVVAEVSNEDIGRVHEGMPATVKVRAFDYLRYGTLHGTVRTVAADATADQGGGHLAYEVTVVTDSAYLGDAGQGFAVSSGMAADVDLLVGERTILSYLTDRLFPLREAFREG